jgi:hypothetical protein
MNRIFQSLCLPVAALTFITAGPMTAAQAAMVPTQQVLGAVAPADVSSDRDRLGNLMARDDVRRELIRLGVDADEANQRIAALSDAEVKRMVGTLDAAPAGGSIVGILLIVLIVLGIVYMARRV